MVFWLIKRTQNVHGIKYRFLETMHHLVNSYYFIDFTVVLIRFHKEIKEQSLRGHSLVKQCAYLGAAMHFEQKIFLFIKSFENQEIGRLYARHPVMTN